MDWKILDKVDLFWDRYTKAVINQRVEAHFDRWHVIRAEQYIKYFEHKLRDHSLKDLETYLSELGRNTALKDWQIKQAVDAIRILLCDISGQSPSVRIVVAPRWRGSNDVSREGKRDTRKSGRKRY